MNKKGYVIIIQTLLFMTVSVILLSGVVNPILSHYSSAKGFMESKKAFQTAESAIEEVIYRLKTNKNLGSNTSITLGSSTADISINTADDTKTITVNGLSGDYERNIVATMVEDVGVSFSYGLQAGKGGLTMGNNSYVSGNVYSNGDIVGSNGAYITGSAFVANASDPTANQTNGTTTPPIYSINFGGVSAPQDIAQSFQVSTTTAITNLRFYIKKQTDSPSYPLSDISVKIVSNNSGQPSKTVQMSGTLRSALVTSSYNYITIPLSPNISLTPGTTYWIVLDASSATPGSNTNYYSIASSMNTYSSGVANIGTWSSTGSGGTWSASSPSGQDIYFDLYVGGDYGTISGLNHVGTAGIGDVWAHEVNNISTIHGTMYCQTSSSIGGGKTCNTSRSDPTEQPYPISDGNIENWKQAAESGGTTSGNVSYTTGTNYIGPRKIVGNLTVTGSTLIITGTLYVTGNITLGNNANLLVDPSFGDNSGIVVADGMVTIDNNATLDGSGDSGSYVLIVTTSSCPYSGSCSGLPAMSVNNNAAGNSLLNAQNGKMTFSNNASAKEATAYMIELSPNANVIYETGISDANFVSGPSGSWYINTWDEVE